MKSVKSNNPCLAGRQECQSPDWIGTSVIQTSYDIVKAHGVTITVESAEKKGRPGEQTGTEFIIQIPIT